MGYKSETCDNCGGDGYNDCSSCDGSGEQECRYCDGKGTETETEEDDEGDEVEVEVECVHCDGEGTERCGSCGGQGNYSCGTCEGSGTETCDSCDGNGHEDCDNCGGSGEVESYEYYYNIESVHYLILGKTLEKYIDKPLPKEFFDDIESDNPSFDYYMILRTNNYMSEDDVDETRKQYGMEDSFVIIQDIDKLEDLQFKIRGLS
jgi:hypothetical protein